MDLNAINRELTATFYNPDGSTVELRNGQHLGTFPLLCFCTDPECAREHGPHRIAIKYPRAMTVWRTRQRERIESEEEETLP